MTVKPFDEIVTTLHELIRRYPTCEGLITSSWDTLYQACTEERIKKDIFEAMDISGMKLEDGPRRLVDSLYNIFWVIHGESDEAFSYDVLEAVDLMVLLYTRCMMEKSELLGYAKGLQAKPKKPLVHLVRMMGRFFVTALSTIKNH